MDLANKHIYLRAVLIYIYIYMYVTDVYASKGGV